MPRFTKTKLALPALVVLLAAGAAGYQLWSQHEARAGLDAALAGLPAGDHGRYDAMSFNAFTQTMRINGLAITRDGHPALTVQAVTLHHLAGSGTLADPFQAATVRLNGTVLWRGSRSVTAGLVQAENLQVLAPGVTPPAGTPAWLVAPGSGTLLAAGTITASGIADSEGATLAALAIADYADGQISDATARGFADQQGNRIATADAHAIDLDGLDAVFDTGRYEPGNPGWPAPRLLIGHAEVMGIQSQGDDGAATVASMVLDGFAGRPFAAAPTAAYVRSPGFARDAAAAVSIGAASVTGLGYRDDKTKLSGTLSAVSVSGYANGALAQASLDGLSLAGTGASRVAVGHFALTRLDATGLLHAPAGASARSLIAAVRQGGVHLASLALAQVSITPPKGQAITLASLVQATSDSEPSRVTLSLRGLSIPAQSNPELAQGLGALGIDPLVLDLDEAGTYDTLHGTAAVDPLVLTARGLGSLTLSAQFTNVPQDLPPGGPPLAAFAGMGLGPFSLRFSNGSLVQRIVAMQARQTGKTPEQVTDEAKLAGSFAAATLVPDQPDAGEQVAAFIADPHVLTITATPADPIPLAAFLGAARDTAKSALNLHLSAN